jgi:site-specific recombinase XerC
MHTTKLIAHKGDNRIALAFEKKLELISLFKKLNGAKWNITCATLFWESRADLHCIQEFLEHNSSKTTEIYTPLSTESLQKLKSPFVDL